MALGCCFKLRFRYKAALLLLGSCLLPAVSGPAPVSTSLWLQGTLLIPEGVRPSAVPLTQAYVSPPLVSLPVGTRFLQPSSFL